MSVLGIMWLALAVMLPLWIILTYNRFVRLAEHLRESWSDVDVELKRRHELVPNLVETVRGHMEYERGTLERVIALRNRAEASRDRPAAAGPDESALQSELGRLFERVEAYPDLKANRQFLSLQRELALTEDRIAAARRFYNGNVRELNTLLETIPVGLIGKIGGFEAAEFFELDGAAERVVPRVET